ncbi:hypothetical protein [Amycolatopsis magusensis]|uniref:Uncharacterized protein n=1 Tax=Amycolatopsis magusensis TaxID=882444 RepID=A0ABS4PHF7_9PSEU|nr:hypothetical protein [Amycolatopsis magusensis]MBP2178798.1 hypothetical protein [Amycolatopsis magusensis]
MLVPDRLADEPSIADAMCAAGFAPGAHPGSWLGRGQIAVDLMTPEALSGPKSRRSAKLRPPHDDKWTARRTLGLEPAVVDNDIHVITELTGESTRSFRLKVAGPAALMVSKVVKIAERRDQPNRLKPKDGLDVLRLLRAIETAQLARGLEKLLAQDLSRRVVEHAMRELRTLATGPEELLPSLAAAAEFDGHDEIRMSTVALVEDLLAEFDAAGIR